MNKHWRRHIYAEPTANHISDSAEHTNYRLIGKEAGCSPWFFWHVVEVSLVEYCSSLYSGSSWPASTTTKLWFHQDLFVEGKVLSWRNSIRLYRPLPVWLNHTVTGCSASCNIRLPGSQRGAAPPLAVRSMRNSLEGNPPGSLLCQISTRRFSAPRNQLQCWCDTSCTPHSAAGCRAVVHAHSHSRIWETWDISLPVTLADSLFLDFPRFQDSGCFVFLPISAQPPPAPDTSSPVPGTPLHPSSRHAGRIWQTRILSTCCFATYLLR